MHRDAAGFALEVWAVFSTHGLKATRDGLNGWHLGIFLLTKTGPASFAAGRTPNVFVPLVPHLENTHSEGGGFL
jgi:hypothetical protein